MTSATLVMAYYENPGMLKVHYEHIRGLPADLRDMLHVVIVDDGSPDHPAWLEDIGVPLQLFRIEVDVRWNQDAARNIGVHYAETDWLLLTDMDHLVPEATWRVLLTKQWDKSIAYYFSRVSAPEMERYHHHPNSWFMNRKLFDEIGGYDERFAGFYGSDSNFRRRLSKEADSKQLKEVIIRYPRTFVADASTTRYLRKQPEDREAMQRINDEIKALPAEERGPRRLSFPYHRVT